MRLIHPDSRFRRPWPLVLVLLATFLPMGCGGEAGPKATGGQAVVPQSLLDAEKAQAEFMKTQGKKKAR